MSKNFEMYFAAAALLSAFVYSLLNVSDAALNLVWVAVTAVPIIFLFVSGRFPGYWFSSAQCRRFTRAFAFNSGLFYLGMVLGDVLRKANGQDVAPGGWRLVIPVTVYGMLAFFALLYFVISGQSDVMVGIEKIGGEVQSLRGPGGVRDWDALLKTVEEGGANVLAVTGNLLSLRTDRGVALLRSFLAKSTSNSVQLAIPAESERYLAELKGKLSDPEMAERVAVRVFQPFWFVQGMVIIGRRDSCFDYELQPHGCFFYRLRQSEEEEMGEEGLFISALEPWATPAFVDALRAQYFLLDKLEYKRAPFSVKQVFNRGSARISPRVRELTLAQA